jgi:hypothetical protein
MNRTRDLCHTSNISNISNTCHPANHSQLQPITANHNQSQPTKTYLHQNITGSLDIILFYETSSWRNVYCSCMLHLLKTWNMRYEIWNLKSEILDIRYEIWNMTYSNIQTFKYDIFKYSNIQIW